MSGRLVGASRQLILLTAGVCAAAALGWGCAAERAETQPPAARAQSSPSGDVAAGLPPAELDAEELAAQKLVARLLQEVAGVRELVPRRPVRSQVVGRAKMLEAVKARIASEVPEAVVAGTQELLFSLGVVPLRFDYEKSLLQLLGTQLAGFYDPDDETMYLAADLDDAERLATLAHELVHALQDQHFDLGALIKYREGASDAQSAVHGLAEGDATSAMADQMLLGQGLRAIDLPEEKLLDSMRASIEEAEQTADVPAILKRAIISPYVDGMALVHWARRRGGWASVDEIWRNLPSSTEQLLHPEKLMAREAPEVVAVPLPPPGGPAHLSYQDVMGELSVRLVLEEWLPDKEAKLAAQDWAGDRVAVFRHGEKHAIAWHVRYDTPLAARRGLVGLAAGVVAAKSLAQEQAGGSNEGSRERGFAGLQVFRRKGAAAQAKAVLSGGTACQERARRGPLAVARSGREVAIVAGPYERGGRAPTAAGSCAAALRWARKVAAQP